MEVLVQLADFFIKAAVNYVQTEQGQKELNDIEIAVGGVLTNVLTADQEAAESVAGQGISQSSNDQPREFKRRDWRQ